MVLIVTTQNHQTLQNGDFGRHRGEDPIWHFWFQRCHFGKGPRKRVFTICDTHKLCSAENTILVLFQQSFAEISECQSKNNRNLPKIGGLFANMHKGVLFYVFFVCLLVLWFFVLFVFVLLGGKKPKKGYFPASFEGFPLLFPKRLLFHILLFFILCVFLVFPFVFPFKIPSFSLLFIHQPLFGKLVFFGGGFLLSFVFCLFLC